MIIERTNQGNLLMSKISGTLTLVLEPMEREIKLFAYSQDGSEIENQVYHLIRYECGRPIRLNNAKERV